LAEEHHFTADRLAAYQALVTENHAALVAQMRQG
jgi:hypothetical protein